MHLNTNGLLTSFYKRTYHLTDYDLPVNFCSFFWKLFFAGALLPATWWTYLCEDFVDRVVHKGGFMGKRVQINMMFLLLAYILGLVVFGIGAAFWYHPYILSSITGGLVLIGASIYIAMRIRDDIDPFDMLGDAAHVIGTKIIESVKERVLPTNRLALKDEGPLHNGRDDDRDSVASHTGRD